MNKFKALHLFSFSLNRANGKENFGDMVGLYIVKRLSKRTIVEAKHPSMRRYKLFLKHYLTVGSILEVANQNSIIWGSGIIRKDDDIKCSKFLLVRGPHTRKRLLELNYKVPELFGDPAIILSDFYTIKRKQKPNFKVGIAPHYVDYEAVVNNVLSDKNISIIDLLTLEVESVIDAISECAIIFSSSLHGVIVAHSYGIPAIWVKFSNRLGGDNIKFFDYFESVGIFDYPEIKIAIQDVTLEYLLDYYKNNKEISLPTEEMINKRKVDIYQSCPF